MLDVISSLKGFELLAKDGSLGSVSDFLFDDRTWKVRWMVVDTGHWLTGRKVLIHPSAVISANYGLRTLTVELSKAQVEASPDILQDRPVSQQVQNDLYSYYGWDPLWGGGSLGGGMYGGAMGGMASPLLAPVYFGASAGRQGEFGREGLDDGDPHLRSVAEVTGYHVHATDGNIGHVEGFLIESTTWGVRYLIVDTSNWWIGQHVLMSPRAVKDVNWSDHRIEFDVTRNAVRSSPSWDPADAINVEFERQLHGHYNWPGFA